MYRLIDTYLANELSECVARDNVRIGNESRYASSCHGIWRSLA